MSFASFLASIIASATCGHSEEKNVEVRAHLFLLVLRGFGLIQREVGVAEAMIKAMLIRCQYQTIELPTRQLDHHEGLMVNTGGWEVCRYGYAPGERIT